MQRLNTPETDISGAGLIPQPRCELAKQSRNCKTQHFSANKCKNLLIHSVEAEFRAELQNRNAQKPEKRRSSST